MAYDRVIKVYNADGVTPDESHFAGGIIASADEPALNTAVRAAFSLGARRGMLGGVLELAGTSRDPFRIGIGKYIVFEREADVPVYAGFVRNRRRSIGGDSHVYELESWWSLLRRCPMGERVVFGSSVSANSDGVIDTGINLTVANGTATTISASATGIKRDWTIRCGTEQMFVTDVDQVNETITVTRGYNGTAAAAHSAQRAYHMTFERRVTGCNSPESIIEWLLDATDGPGQITQTLGVTYEAGDIEASGVTVSEYIVDANADIYQVIEDLELLARSGGEYYVAGIDADKHFYFHSVSTAAADLQSAFAVGAASAAAPDSGDEETRGADVANSLVIVGGMMPARGLMAKKSFSDSASVAAYGASKTYRRIVPGLRNEADMEKWAAGFFQAYANPVTTIGGLSRALGDDEAFPLPWLGEIKLSDSATGLVAQGPAPQIDIEFGPVVDIRASIGRDEIAAAGSVYAPGSESGGGLFGESGGGAQDNGDGLIEALIDSLPTVTDETPGWDAPHLTGEDVSIGVEDGTIGLEELGPDVLAAIEAGGGDTGIDGDIQIVDFHFPGGGAVTTGEAIRMIARVRNGGSHDTLTANGNTNPVRFVFKLVYQDGNGAWNQVAESGSFIAALDTTEGDFEQYVMAEGDGLTPSRAGRLYVGVRLLQISEALEESNYYYPPGLDILNATTDELAQSGVWVRVLESAVMSASAVYITAVCGFPT